MPIRDRIIWGNNNPFSDPRLAGLDQVVRDIRRGRPTPIARSGGPFKNDKFDLPVRPHGYYREYYVTAKVPGQNRDQLRLVLGAGGEVYITGHHYDDFRQVINMPM